MGKAYEGAPAAAYTRVLRLFGGRGIIANSCRMIHLNSPPNYNRKLNATTMHNNSTIIHTSDKLNHTTERPVTNVIS